MKLPILIFANFMASIAMGIALTVVPWELSNTLGGDKILAFTATWATALLIFVSPIAGRIIDGISRRTALVSCVCAMAVVLQITAFAYDNVVTRLISLSVFYFLSQMFFLFYSNALTAFIQEIFNENQRGKVNGWMQVEMQVSTFVVGGLVIYFVTDSDFKNVLTANAILLFISTFMLWFIPYKIHERPQQAKIAKLVYLTILKRKDLFLLGLADGAKFSCVMMMNIIHPIYFSQVLKLDVSSVAMLSVSWGLGAAIFGFSVSRFVSQKSGLIFVKIGTGIYTIALFFMAMFPQFISILFLFGLCGAMGATTRVAFNTYVMSAVDKSIFGSYLGVVSTTTYIQRTIFGLALALIITRFPASNYYWFVFGIGVFSFTLLLLHSLFASNAKLEMTPKKTI